jgi:hypothetical protein
MTVLPSTAPMQDAERLRGSRALSVAAKLRRVESDDDGGRCIWEL